MKNTRGHYFLFVISMRRGEAIQMEEYVPTSPPKMSARVNPLRLAGPKMNIAMRTMITVREVKSDRLIVS